MTTRFKGGVEHARFQDSGNHFQASPFAGLPIGVQFLCEYDVFKPFNYFYGDELPGFAATDLEPHAGGCWTVTDSGSGTISFPNSQRYRRLAMLSSAADNSTLQIQYANTDADDYITNVIDKNQFFSTVLTISDADNDANTLAFTEFFVGFAAEDTSIFGGVTDFVGFYKPETSATVGTATAAAGEVFLVSGKDTTGFSTSDHHQVVKTLDSDNVGTGSPTTRVRFDFLMTRSRDTVVGWVDGVHVGTLTGTSGIPQNDDMTITVGVANRDATSQAKQLNIYNLLIALEI